MTYIYKKKQTQYNNPANIEIGQGYAGEIEGQTYADRFAVFDSPQMGVRALFRDLQTKIKRHNGDINAIMEQFAPTHENDTVSYADYVISQVGKNNVTLDDLSSMTKAIIEYENGINSPLVTTYLQEDVFKEALELSKHSMPQSYTLDKAREFMSTIPSSK
jgi:hypothetical protein